MLEKILWFHHDFPQLTFYSSTIRVQLVAVAWHGIFLLLFYFGCILAFHFSPLPFFHLLSLHFVLLDIHRLSPTLLTPPLDSLMWSGFCLGLPAISLFMVNCVCHHGERQADGWTSPHLIHSISFCLCFSLVGSCEPRSGERNRISGS